MHFFVAFALFALRMPRMWPTSSIVLWLAFTKRAVIRVLSDFPSAVICIPILWAMVLSVFKIISLFFLSLLFVLGSTFYSSFFISHSIFLSLFCFGQIFRSFASVFMILTFASFFLQFVFMIFLIDWSSLPRTTFLKFDSKRPALDLLFIQSIKNDISRPRVFRLYKGIVIGIFMSLFDLNFRIFRNFLNQRAQYLINFLHCKRFIKVSDIKLMAVPSFSGFGQ